MGPEAFKILVNHFRPDGVNTKTNDEVKTAMQNFFAKKVCILAERLDLQFVNNLRSLAGNCEFGNTLAERIRDQLVIGINNTM